MRINNHSSFSLASVLRCFSGLHFSCLRCSQWLLINNSRTYHILKKEITCYSLRVTRHCFPRHCFSPVSFSPVSIFSFDFLLLTHLQFLPGLSRGMPRKNVPSQSPDGVKQSIILPFFLKTEWFTMSGICRLHKMGNTLWRYCE